MDIKMEASEMEVLNEVILELRNELSGKVCLLNEGRNNSPCVRYSTNDELVFIDIPLEWILDEYRLRGDVSKMINTYTSNIKEVELKFQWTNFDSVKERVTCYLVNTKMNKGLLDGYITETVGCTDLTMVVALDLPQLGYCLVSNKILSVWNMDEYKIICLAKKNLCKDAAIANVTEDIDGLGTFKVVTNIPTLLGAAQMLNYSFMDDLVDKYGDGEGLVVIPSSVDEFLIMQLTLENILMSIEYIKKINRDILFPSDVLSDVAYGYDKERGLYPLAESLPSLPMAQRILEYMKEYDYYEILDNLDSPEPTEIGEALVEVDRLIRSSNVEPIIRWIKDTEIDDEDIDLVISYLEGILVGKED